MERATWIYIPGFGRANRCEGVCSASSLRAALNTPTGKTSASSPSVLADRLFPSFPTAADGLWKWKLSPRDVGTPGSWLVPGVAVSHIHHRLQSMSDTWQHWGLTATFNSPHPPPPPPSTFEWTVFKAERNTLHHQWPAPQPRYYELWWSTFGFCLESPFHHIALNVSLYDVLLGSGDFTAWARDLWNLTHHTEESRPETKVLNVKEYMFEPRKRWKQSMSSQH